MCLGTRYKVELHSVWAASSAGIHLPQSPRLNIGGKGKRCLWKRLCLGIQWALLHDLVIKIGTKPTTLDDK